MSGFNKNVFRKKLATLDNSAQKIQTLSLWLIHHRKHYATVVKVWIEELVKADDCRKLMFMYLANDVIQNSRKKGTEYGSEFAVHLKSAFQHLSTCNNDKTLNSLERILSIWKEREIYSKLQIEEFTTALLACTPGSDKPPAKRIRLSKEGKTGDHQVTVEIDGILETHVQLSPHTPTADPPDAEEIIKAIQDLENNIASADEAVRQRIAQLPPSVTEVSSMNSIEDKEQAEKMGKLVQDAVALLNDYNNRLNTEMKHRKKVTSMITDFVQVQQELLTQAEQTLEEYQDKLIKVYNVKNELKSHIQNLPDLTQLPNVTDGLAPLPSAENLFML